MNENHNASNRSRAARRASERRRAEQRSRRLTMAICAVLLLLVLGLSAVLLAGGPDGALPAAAPAVGMQPSASVQAPAEAPPSPEVAPMPSQPPVQATEPPVPTATQQAAAASSIPPTSAAASPSPAASLVATPQASATPLAGADVASRETAQVPVDIPIFEAEDELVETSILITAVGDCTLGGNVGTSSGGRFAQYAEEYGLDYFFANVRDIFAEDDFTIVNLEGPLTTQSSKRPNRQFNFRGSPEFVQILSGSSVEVCTVANNHALDFKEAGLNDTAENITNAGMGVAGYKNAWYGEKDGVRICFLAFTEWDYSVDDVSARVREEKGGSDIVIVSMHWGEELRARPTDTQVRYGRALIDAGADLVLGSHPHVVGGLEQYKGKYIVYSLGNFCFGGNSNPDDKDTIIFQQTFNVTGAGEVTDGGINIIPCSISSVPSTNNYQPTPLDGEAAEAVIGKVSSLSSVEEILWMDSYTGMR